ncbi:Orotate phosphoribosyltransferase [Rhodococcus sp. AW25M09]|nr:Orotate phosphoribosyltransferase [Rhodococcus sp. AW25M09]
MNLKVTVKMMAPRISHSTIKGTAAPPMSTVKKTKFDTAAEIGSNALLIAVSIELSVPPSAARKSVEWG